MLKTIVSLLLLLSLTMTLCISGDGCAARAGNDTGTQIISSNNTQNMPCKDASAGVSHHCMCKHHALGDAHLLQKNMFALRNMFFVANDAVKTSFMLAPLLKPPSA